MSLYIPNLANDEFGTFVQGLAGNFEKIESEFTKWRRVDTLSAPLDISDATYANQGQVPLSVEVYENSLYAIEFRLPTPEVRQSYMHIDRGYTSSNAKQIAVTSRGHTVRIIRGSTRHMNFYKSSGDTEHDVFVAAVYLIKEGI